MSNAVRLEDLPALDALRVQRQKLVALRDAAAKRIGTSNQILSFTDHVPPQDYCDQIYKVMVRGIEQQILELDSRFGELGVRVPLTPPLRFAGETTAERQPPVLPPPVAAAALLLLRRAHAAAIQIDDVLEDKANGHANPQSPDGSTYAELWDKAIDPIVEFLRDIDCGLFDATQEQRHSAARKLVELVEQRIQTGSSEAADGLTAALRSFKGWFPEAL